MSKSKTAERYAQYQAALDVAYQAASDAQRGLVEDMNAFDCGFAWVVTHDASFNGWCRKMAKSLNDLGHRTDARRYGDKHHPSGWCFWKPGSFNGQSVGIHEKGAKAFSESLARWLGISCSWSSRLD